MKWHFEENKTVHYSINKMATMTQNRQTVVSYPISIHIHFGRILCKRRKVNRLLFIWKPHINVKQNIIQNLQRREKKARRPYRDEHFAWNFIQWKFIGNHMTNKLLSTLNGTMALALYTFSIICLILLAGKSFFPSPIRGFSSRFLAIIKSIY